MMLKQQQLIGSQNTLQQKLQTTKKNLLQCAEDHSQVNIGDYTFSFQNIIGKGSFSKVYRGYKQNNQKHQVAVKVIEKTLLNADLKILIDSQIHILKIVNHPNIIKCYDIKQDQRNIYLIMELCQGGDLQTKIDQNGPFNEADAKNIIKGVFNGLSYLSERNIIHRDIKVANIFLQKNTPKIADFGFAVLSKDKKHFQDISIGSPIYMSPQGIKHNVYGPTTDVWSFGVFIYELLHGTTPYSHCKKEKQLKYNISNQLGWYNLKPNLSYSIKQVIYKCLQINYDKRITFQKLKQLDFFRQLEKSNPQNIEQRSPKNLDKRLKIQSEIQFKLLKTQPLLRDPIQNKETKTNSKSFNFLSPLNFKYKDQLIKSSKTLRQIDYCLKSQPNQQDYLDSYEKFKACIKTNFSQVLKNDYFTFNEPQRKYGKNIHKTNENLRFYKQKSNKTLKEGQFSFFNDEQHRQYSPQREKLSNKSLYNNQLNLPRNKQHKRFNTERSTQKYNLDLSKKSNSTTSNNFHNKNTLHHVSLKFPSENINCYLYMIHFTRLLFKLATLMQYRRNLDTIKCHIQIFCKQILKQTQKKIDSYLAQKSKSTFYQQKETGDFVKIQQTINKYLLQYGKQYFVNQKVKIQRDSFISMNLRLEKEMNMILSNELKMVKSNAQTVKLLYLAWIYGYHFNEIFLHYFMNEESKHWYFYSLPQIVRQIESDIDLSNNLTTLQSYLNLKRKKQPKQVPIDIRKK